MGESSSDSADCGRNSWFSLPSSASARTGCELVNMLAISALCLLEVCTLRCRVKFAMTSGICSTDMGGFSIASQYALLFRSLLSLQRCRPGRGLLNISSRSPVSSPLSFITPFPSVISRSPFGSAVFPSPVRGSGAAGYLPSCPKALLRGCRLLTSRWASVVLICCSSIPSSISLCICRYRT